MKKPLIILTGPTAVGKTKLSIQLAKSINGEIISADSMQVYKHMNIGSAKVTKEEMDGVPHHLIDILEPTEEFNVVLFQRLCKKAMEEIYQRNCIPIITGGTGFYIQAVLYDIDFAANEEETRYRRELEELAQKEGNEALHQMLQNVDPASGEAIHPNNVKRVIRALEFFHQTGEKISAHNEQERQKEAAYQAAYFILNDEREEVYRRIDQRVDYMLEKGLVEEVAELKEMGLTSKNISMQGLGYKEILAFLEGEITLEEAIYILKRDTRHFAKRQLTWFRREKNIIWIDKNQFHYNDERIVEFMNEQINTFMK